MAHDIQMPLAIDDIEIADSRRPINAAAVKRLADSIEHVGLRHPITVRRKGDDYALIAGRHRIEAFRKLGKEHIPATIVTMTNDNARLWEIAENLHRSELSNIERAASIDEWRKITERIASHDVTPLGGKQPTESGIRKTAESLGVSHETVRRARQITSIDDGAKEAAISAGITSVDDLVEVSREPTAQAQIAKVARLAAVKLADEPLNDFETTEKQVAALMAAWNRAGPEARSQFLGRVDTPIMDKRFA